MCLRVFVNLIGGAVMAADAATSAVPVKLGCSAILRVRAVARFYTSDEPCRVDSGEILGMLLLPTNTDVHQTPRHAQVVVSTSFLRPCASAENCRDPAVCADSAHLGSLVGFSCVGFAVD